MSDKLNTHLKYVINAIARGRVIPFFGAGVNLYGRKKWQFGTNLPSGYELAAYLAEEFAYPQGEVQVHCQSCNSQIPEVQVLCPSCSKSVPLTMQDLARVSQYVAIMTGTGPLYEELHRLFAADYEPTSLHQFFATLPRLLREKGYPYPYQLIVTTNYDDVMEQALIDAKEPYDLVCYMTDREQSGKFLHRSADGQSCLIEEPNRYSDLPFETLGNNVIVKRNIILKIHGAVDKTDPDSDSFVITEDHYINYLAHTDISNLLPKWLAAKLRRSHFLFLGYGLRDWNLRVILHRIWGNNKLSWRSWAIQRDPDPLDEVFWRKREVDIINVDLEEYIAALSEQLHALPSTGGSP
jgi:hypothetical protein